MAVPSPRVALEPGISVGEGAIIGQLQLFPIFSTRQESIGEFTTLPLALQTGAALVQEQAGGAEVGRVEIVNRGRVPIVVLAGTIIKGGKQDRQIGQDYIIGPRQRVPVEAFCVEHGRWDGVREGVSTGGSFSASGLLTTREVRLAAEFKRDQSAVWSEVAKANDAAGKQPASGTFAAVVDDQELARKRKILATQAKQALLERADRSAVVGLAYAIGGKVQGARWFAHHDLLAQLGDALLETAAMEALDADARARAAGHASPHAARPVPAARVVEFIAARKQAARTERRVTSGANENEYIYSAGGYRSQTRFKSSAKAPARPVMDAAY
jgi:hypothetical protein